MYAQLNVFLMIQVNKDEIFVFCCVGRELYMNTTIAALVVA